MTTAHTQRWAWRLLAAVMVTGVALRLFNVGHMVYWKDEAYTSLRISGYDEVEVREAVFDGHEVGAQEILKYQQVNPERNVVDSLRSLAAGDPHLMPGYIGLVRLWATALGDSPATIRLFSVLAGCLAFPCLFWLCRELFGATRAGWVALALLAVSPFHLLYAQEAREYSLWTVAILLSSAALLRALRLPTRTSWWLYAATVALGLYTHLLFGLVVAAHGVYVGGLQLRTVRPIGFQWRPVVRNFLLAITGGLILFAPWLVVLLVNLPQAQAQTGWMLRSQDRFELLTRFAGHFGPVFFQINHGVTDLIAVLSRIVVLSLVGVAMYTLVRRAERRVWLFVGALLIVPALGLLGPDLLFGGNRSHMHRFLVPSFLAVELAVTYLIAATRRPQVGWAILAVLVAGGLASCLMIARAESWWNKGDHGDSLRPVAHRINASPRPLLIVQTTGTNFGDLLALSHELGPHVRVRGAPQLPLPAATAGFHDVFVYNPILALQVELQQNGYERLTEIPRGMLWKLKK